MRGLERALGVIVVKRHAGGRGEVPPLDLAELQIRSHSRIRHYPRHVQVDLLPERRAGRREVGLQRRSVQPGCGAIRISLGDARGQAVVPVAQFHAERRCHADSVRFQRLEEAEAPIARGAIQPRSGAQIRVPDAVGAPRQRCRAGLRREVCVAGVGGDGQTVAAKPHRARGDRERRSVGVRPNRRRAGRDQQLEGFCNALSRIADQVDMLERSASQRDCGGIAEAGRARKQDGGRGVLVAGAGQFVEPHGAGIMIGPAFEAQRVDEPGRPFGRDGLRVQRVPVGCQRRGRAGAEHRQVCRGHRDFQEIEVHVRPRSAGVRDRDGVLRLP